ncbi:uncharacterized protein LOC105259535 [Camponotus floridanus]|uniref:uncharacterized protein LOC105259535 n=1 Tax=Camponotus floridanus TaxID=104421 RepID=UPI000DC6CC2B|nr:uncharacterized protein LOC105259535 [Camponotus floridanus]XP_011269822.2 uncharacterized protein LOC105259535 [Camponotus floridanus]
MPGIHLQTFSKFDWLNPEKESLLTIPGSYWLCHKKNIYKFIFKYHRTVKNPMQFSYGRELLKIVRRIIKCHPNRGQQFDTSHLLVTYNCTSWTRRDKMFAILKFQQRSNAATFSHAFVLTISLKYPTVKEADADTTFKNLNVSLDTKEKITENAGESLNATTAEVHFVDAEFQDNINENKSKNCNIKTCEENIDQHAIDRDVKKQSLKSTKKMDKISIEKLDDGNEETKSIAVQKSNQEMQNNRRYKIFSSLESGIIKDDVSKWTLSNGFGFYEDSMETNICPLNDKNVLDDGRKMINETIADSDNISDQYFIEKEIQCNKRSNSSFSTISQPLQKDFRAEMKNINEHSTLEVIKRNNNESIHTKLKEHNNEMTKTDLKFEDNKQHTTIIIDNNLSTNNTYKSYKSRKQKGREFERKTISDDKVLRSSNITDLVMEGLMFTIRQDQDSVAVIEQKTKLEMDEVLENSEKVETKAGEKCLLNSSLLKLENLVTMIDSPHNEQQHKTCHAISNSTCLSPFSSFSSSTIYNLDVNSIDEKMDKLNIPTNYDKHIVKDYLNPCESRWQNKYISSSIKNNDDCSSRGMITEGNKQLMKQQDDNENNREDRNNIETEEEKRKDFIPQALQPTLVSSEKKNGGLQNGDLLTGNTDAEEANKYEISAKRFYNSPLSSYSSPRRMFAKKENSISEESASIMLAQQEANGPRIISDKAITFEQMSPTLQKVLRHTRRLSSNSKTFQCEQETQHVTSTENAFSETAISFKDNDTSLNTSSVELGADSEEIKGPKSESCLTINKDAPETIEDTKIYDNEDTRVSTREKTNESNRASRRNSSSKNGSPRKLQDITEDFYYDLLHVRNKDNAIRQRCLRRRQRSLNNSDNIKNGKVRIEMLKFIQDITEGARVVVRRLNIDNKSNLSERGST